MEDNPYEPEFIPSKNSSMDNHNINNLESNLESNLEQSTQQENALNPSNPLTPSDTPAVQDTNNTVDNENFITLVDGTRIEAYPIKDAPPSQYWKGMKLDSTGQYFVISGKKPKEKSPREKEAVVAESFFLEHAFFFLANARRILSDSRMFLCPVPVQSGIAYTGTSGFTAPTLGVYIEWWLNTPASMLQDKKGNKYLTWHIAGSPLSGSNRCSVVDAQGKSHIHSFSRFSKLWRSFVEINTRYQTYKGRCEAYTLEEVYKLLGGQDAQNNTPQQKENRSLAIECFFLRSQCESLAIELTKKENEANSLRDELVRTRIEFHLLELRKIYQRYIEKKKEIEAQSQELLDRRIILRKRLRSGQITAKEFQKLVGPINKELNDIKYSPFEEFDYLPKQYKVTFSDVVEYFESEARKREEMNLD